MEGVPTGASVHTGFMRCVRRVAFCAATPSLALGNFHAMGIRRFDVLLVALAVAFVALLTAVKGEAKEDKSIVVWVEGPDADRIRNMLSDDVPQGLIVVDADQAKALLSKAGAKPPIHKTLDDGKKRNKFFDKLKKAQSGSKISAVLLGSSKKGGKVHLWLVTSDGVGLDKDVALSKKKKDKDAEDAKILGDAVSDSLKSLAPPPEPEPTPEPTPTAAEEKSTAAAEGESEEKKIDEGEEEPSTPAGARKKHDPARSLFEVAGGADIGIRKLSFDNRQTANIRGYNVTGAPGIFVAAEVYPLAGGKGIARDIGLIVDYAQAIGLKSAPSGGDKLDTTWNRWEIGVRARFRLGDDPAPMIGAVLAYGHEAFSIDTADPVLGSQTPSATYKFIRIGVDARVPVGSVALFGGFDFLLPSATSCDANDTCTAATAPGDVAGRFRGTKISGLGAHIGFGLTLMEGLEARLAARITHFGYTFSPQTGDTYVADSASDTLTSVMLGVAYVF